MRRSAIASLLLAFALVLTGCGLGGKTIDDIDVSKGDVPTIEFKKGFEADKTESRVIKKGDGDEILDGDSVQVHYVAANGRTGEVFDNSHELDSPMSLSVSESTALPGFYQGLLGQNIGSRVLVIIPPADGVAHLGSVEAMGLEENDTLVFVFDILEKTPTEASGEAKKAPANLPELQFNDKKQPEKFKSTKTSDKKLSKTQSAVIIKGEGAKIEAGQVVTAHYIGQLFPDGEVFNNSWTSSPQQFPVGSGGLIPCWDDELVGQTIGSRVIIACTKADAYGDSAAEQGSPEGPLIFVVDLLSAI